MKIIRAYPPNFVQIRTAFPAVVGRQGILYAWGDRIYNPSGVNVPWWLQEHEEVHGSRQLDPKAWGAQHFSEDHMIRTWWSAYIEDPEFRLQEEIPAHQAEWEVFKSLMTNKKNQEMYLLNMANRLSGELYGNMISLQDAVSEITSGR